MGSRGRYLVAKQSKRKGNVRRKKAIMNRNRELGRQRRHNNQVNVRGNELQEPVLEQSQDVAEPAAGILYNFFG